MCFVDDDADLKAQVAKVGEHVVQRGESSVVRRTLRASLLRAATAAHVLYENVAVATACGHAVVVHVSHPQRTGLLHQCVACLRHKAGVGGKPEPDNARRQSAAQPFQRAPEHQGFAGAGRRLQQHDAIGQRHGAAKTRIFVVMFRHSRDGALQPFDRALLIGCERMALLDIAAHCWNLLTSVSRTGFTSMSRPARCGAIWPVAEA